jgi:hypothetical protein
MFHARVPIRKEPVDLGSEGTARCHTVEVDQERPAGMSVEWRLDSQRLAQYVDQFPESFAGWVKSQRVVYKPLRLGVLASTC